MKVVILAGGLGTRLREETDYRPKPMVEIGGKPVLWHIMKIYSSHGLNDFIICLGYKGYMIKEYFANYFLHMSDVTFDMAKNKMEVHENSAEPWKDMLVDTKKAELFSDFVIEPGPRSTHVLNAVSSAFTSSAPSAEYVVSSMNLKG